MKRVFAMLTGILLVAPLAVLAGCSNAQTMPGDRLIRVTVAGTDTEMWSAVRDDFNEANEGGYVVEFSVAQNPEAVLENQFNNGQAPDLVLLPTGRGEGFTESLVRGRALHGLGDLLERNVFGEDVKLRDKFLNGFLSTAATNPYQSELSSETQTYMLPVSFTPYGLFYNTDLMGGGTYELPSAWDGYLNMRPAVTAANENVAENERLYMYGYTSAQDNEAIIAPTVATYGGITLAERFLNYDYIYDNAGFASAVTTFGEINSLLSTGESESGLGNYVLSQNAVQALIDGKLMFLAGGESTFAQFEAEGITGYDASKIGFTAAFAANDSSQRYTMTDFEQIYIPSQADNVAGAEEFLLYLFSNRAADILLDHGTVLPTRYALDNMSGHVTAQQELLYSVFEDGTVRPCYGQEAVIDADALAAVEVNWDSAFSGNFTTNVLIGRNTDVWLDGMKSTVVKLRSALLGN